jgi:hypothetical protein
MKFPIKNQYIIIGIICISILIGLSYYFYKEGFQSSSDDTPTVKKFEGDKAVYMCAGFKKSILTYEELLASESVEYQKKFYTNVISTLNDQLRFHNCDKVISETEIVPTIIPIIEAPTTDISGNTIKTEVAA